MLTLQFPPDPVAGCRFDVQHLIVAAVECTARHRILRLTASPAIFLGWPLGLLRFLAGSMKGTSIPEISRVRSATWAPSQNTHSASGAEAVATPPRT